jgi:hypothetical protein
MIMAPLTLQKLYNIKQIEDGMRLIEHCLEGTKSCEAVHSRITDVVVQLFSTFSAGIGYA